jgi:hypothetical protein
MKNTPKVIIYLSLILTGGPSFSESLRCGGNIARIGDGKASIQIKCGEPVSSYSFCKPLIVVPEGRDLVDSSSAACVPVDEWTYAPGSGQFVTTLIFQNGSLSAIRYGDRIP